MVDPVGLAGAGGIQGPQPVRPPAPADQDAPSFKEMLLSSIEEVNKLQADATTAVEDLATGERNDLETVLLATSKADTAFRMLLSVRNKMMDAYTEIQSIRV